MSDTSTPQSAIIPDDELYIFDFHLRTPVGLAPLSGLPFDHVRAIDIIEQVIASHRALTTLSEAERERFETELESMRQALADTMDRSSAQSAALAGRDTTIAELVLALRLIRGTAWHDCETTDIAATLHNIANRALSPVETGEQETT